MHDRTRQATGRSRSLAKLRMAARDDVPTIAEWHPMEPEKVLGWWAGADVVAWVLEDDGELVGYGELWLDTEEEEVELARLIVPEPLRGQGYGGRLTVALTAEAGRTGMTTTMLRTTDDNTAAIACYAAQGFVRLPPEEKTWNEGQRRE
jgi:ribosomal protein S18 acetylase RimI-like enzyme